MWIEHLVAMFVADAQDVTKAVGCKQRRQRSLALDHGVRYDGLAWTSTSVTALGSLLAFFRIASMARKNPMSRLSGVVIVLSGL
jgi:hypothetical protein